MRHNRFFNRYALVISFLALLLFMIYSLLPDKPDTVQLILIGLIIVPWLIHWFSPIIQAIEVPGVLRIELKELTKQQAAAERAGLLETPAHNPEPVYISMAHSDPNLALAGLRIEIERRLRRIAESYGWGNNRQSISQLIQILGQHSLLTRQELSVIRDLVGTLNMAVHGAEVDPKVVDWVIEVGPGILAALDARMQESSKTEESSLGASL